MRTDDLDYILPPELIAQTPAERRDEAKLMVVRLPGGGVEHRHVHALPSLLRPGDLLVMNDTRVLPARFYATRSTTGGRVEGLYLCSLDHHTWHTLLKSGGHPAPGESLTLDDEHSLLLLDKQPDGSWHARLQGPLGSTKLAAGDTLQLLHRVGVMPLPPYIQRKPEQLPQFADLDRLRYQTVYADRPGAIAAPTAGLHFTPQLLDQLHDKGVQTARLTLHVGPGTFAPVRTDTLEEHAMHSEWFSVPTTTLDAIARARRESRRIIPIGTTSVRALESLPDPPPLAADYAADTRLLIQPGFRFRFTDGLMTNFHLPRSTLLALVAARLSSPKSALTGPDRLKQLYRLAIQHRYRFYSYGDAMLILPDHANRNIEPRTEARASLPISPRWLPPAAQC